MSVTTTLILLCCFTVVTHFSSALHENSRKPQILFTKGFEYQRPDGPIWVPAGVTNFTLTCQGVDTEDPLIYRWFHNSNEVDFNANEIEGTLTLAPIATLSDSGQYQCIAWTQDMLKFVSSEPIQVTVVQRMAASSGQQPIPSNLSSDAAQAGFQFAPEDLPLQEDADCLNTDLSGAGPSTNGMSPWPCDVKDSPADVKPEIKNFCTSAPTMQSSQLLASTSGAMPDFWSEPNAAQLSASGVQVSGAQIKWEPVESADVKKEEPVEPSEVKKEEPVELTDVKKEEPVEPSEVKKEEPVEPPEVKKEEPAELADVKKEEKDYSGCAIANAGSRKGESIL